MRYTPHDYQVYAIDYIESHPIATVFLDMGLGKTSITLTAINDLLFDSFEVHKVLVIAPLRVARDTWTAEVDKWDHLQNLICSVAVGTEPQRRAAFMQKADIYIINRENVQWLVEESGIVFDFDMVVIDELSSFKNHSTKRFKALLKVRPKVNRIVGLTGTPASNGLMDLWAEFRILDMGQRLGRFITKYRTDYFQPDKRNGQIIYSYKPLPYAEDAIYRQISDITISMKAADHLQMPELVSSEYAVQLSDEERGHYDEMKQELVLTLGDGEITAANAASLSGKLSQMANGAIYDDIPEPPKGRWDSAGSVLGDGYSVAWRTLDAQFWGVPQRRKRIYLVADFTGGSAGKILFESEGLSGYSPQGFRSWQGTACGTKSGIGAAGIDGYNGDVTGDVSATLGVNCGMSTGRNGVVLNDQGGNRMDITDEVTCTLRAEAHHPPCVMDAAGFCTEHSAKARSIGYEEECSPTLRAGTVPATVYENHSQDTRYTGPLEIAPTVSSTYGMGGNNQPFVVSEGTPYTLKIRSGCEGGGKGALIQTDKSATLATNNDQTLFEPCAWDGSQVSPTLTKQNAGGSQRMPDKDNFNCVLQPYGICSKDSNSMKSDNPHSGIYEAETARTLDGNGGNPSCNQGGIAIVESYSIQGSMIGRKDKNGPQGDGINEDVSFTLNTADRHAVYAMTTGSYMQTTENQSPTLMARDYKDPAAVAYGIGRDAMNQGTDDVRITFRNGAEIKA